MIMTARLPVSGSWRRSARLQLSRKIVMLEAVKV
jgi:hypothetical protein